MCPGREAAREETRKRQEGVWKRDAEKARLRKEEEERRARQRKESLVAEYGRAIADRILAGKYWLGMTRDMARESLGRPSDINRTVNAFGTREQWVYRRYDLYLYFDDGVLTSWQD